MGDFEFELFVGMNCSWRASKSQVNLHLLSARRHHFPVHGECHAIPVNDTRTKFTELSDVLGREKRT
jgi:hypothetical protein